MKSLQKKYHILVKARAAGVRTITNVTITLYNESLIQSYHRKLCSAPNLHQQKSTMWPFRRDEKTRTFSEEITLVKDYFNKLELIDNS